MSVTDNRTSCAARGDLFVSDTYRQKLLMVCTESNTPNSAIIAWSLHDGTGAYDFDASDLYDPAEPPYPHILAAMRAGWRVMQVPTMHNGSNHQNYELGVLPYEWILEQWECINDSL